MWLFTAESKGIPEDGSISPEQFKQMSTELMLDRGDTGFAQLLRPCIRAVADICDEDGDGQIDPDEFARWIRAIGVENDPQELFRRLDKNGDGLLSTEELVAAVRDYHSGDLDVPLLGK
jgi:Ca2+-binding EF-hand superfamily protein